MPIANCVILELEAINLDGIIEQWASYAGISASEMTLNFVEGGYQKGKHYKVMATLYLPSIWSQPQLDAIQTGLSKALSISFSCRERDIHIITMIIESGHVVENGEIQRWS